MVSATPTLEPQLKDFWVSYNKADRRLAEWVAWQLEEEGYSVIIQAWDFPAGSNFVLEMDRAAKEANRTIPLLSPDYLGAPFPQSEWAAAFKHDPTGADRKLLPVRVRECEVDGLLGQVVYIDLVDRDEDSARHALLAGVQLKRSKPETPPPYPGMGAQHIVAEPKRYPGALPPIWNVPHLRKPSFTGRQDELRLLWENFDSGDLIRANQAIHGRGGIGKTRIAVEFAFSYASNYDIVWWVRADTSATLSADLAALASALDLPEGNQSDQARAVESVRRWLSQHSGWLLILDNAQDAESLRPFLPPVSSGHVLITSQNASWRDVAVSSAVSDLAVDAAAQFLMKRSGQSDANAANALASDLGGLPLALEQAGAYIETTGCGLAQYRELFKERQRELLAIGPIPGDYPHTVATTWDLAFRRVEDSFGPATNLLDIAAFIAPTEMRVSDLRIGASQLTDDLATALADEIVFHQMISALQRYSLLDIEVDGFASHTLVQAVTRSRLDRETEIAVALFAVDLIGWAFPEDPTMPTAWPTCERLLLHALATTGHVMRLGESSQMVAALLTNVGGYFMARAQPAEAKAVFQQALDMTEENVANDDPEFALRLNNLGSALSDLNDASSARTCYERAIAILRPAGPEWLESLGKSVSNLGSVLKDQNDPEGALENAYEALRIHETILGRNHPTTAIDLNNIGVAYRDKSEWDLALPFLDEAVTTLRLTVGQNDPRYAMAASSLGVVLFNLGRKNEARRHLDDAARIGIEVHGERHPAVVWFLTLLAGFLEANGEVEVARQTADRALRISQEIHGRTNPKTQKLIQLYNRLLFTYRDPRIQHRPINRRP